MAVEHVVVNEIGDDETAGFFARPFFDHGLGVGVIAGVDGFGDAAMGEDVLDFADGIDGDIVIHEAFEDGGLIGAIGEILAVFRALEAAGLADEGAGDDAADAERVAQAAGDFAVAIQFGHGHDFFVRGDLEHAVGGGVANQRTGAHVFFAEFFDDFGAARGFIADELAAGFFLKIGNQIGGERVFTREVVEAGVHFEAGDFPVAGNGVFAVGHFAHGAP